MFVAPEGCPNCGKAQRRIRHVAPDYAGVDVREVHMTEAADRVVEYGVLTTPFIVIDGRVEFVGVPRERDLRERITAAPAVPGVTD